ASSGGHLQLAPVVVALSARRAWYGGARDEEARPQAATHGGRATQHRAPEAQRGSGEQTAHRQRPHRPAKKSARGPGDCTPRERRRQLMDLVEDLAEPGVSVVAACVAVGVSRATLYRATAPSAPPTVRQRAPS